MSHDGNELYRRFIAMTAASLAPDEYWCVEHDDGALPETASKDIGHPVRVFCSGLNIDWDQATDAGYRLGKIRLPTGDAA